MPADVPNSVGLSNERAVWLQLLQLAGLMIILHQAFEDAGAIVRLVLGFSFGLLGLFYATRKRIVPHS